MKTNQKKITTTFAILLTFVISNCFSQNYFITTSRDSVSCRRINFFDTNAQGRMVDFEYVNNDNVTIRLKKNDIPDIQRLCQYGALYLRMPLNIKKPDGYYRYGKRMVKGKIIVDVYDDVTTSYKLKENFDGSYNQQGVMRQKTEGLYMRRVLMPDGKVYEVSGLKGIKALKSIRKYMFECEQYKKEYFENPKYQTCTFEEAVFDYNNMCP